jgi:leucine dehydrogenase
MDVFASSAFDHHEQVVFAHDRASGLRAIVAVHDTTLGPAVGGCRMWPYRSEEEALDDVLRLSRGMTCKAAMAGVPYGGGKTVIIGDPARDKSPALLAALGRAIDSLGGRYWTAEDVGTTAADMEAIASGTRHVLGRSGQGGGDPSPMTALGVLEGIAVALRHRLGREGVRGARVAIQGLGQVGFALARALAAEGATLIVADIDPARTARAEAELGARVVGPGEVHAVETEVFAPCALGAVLDDRTIPELGAPIVAGSANNQLAAERHGGALAARGVLYVPDYVINAGGLISVVEELAPAGWSRSRAEARVRGIGATLDALFTQARREGRPTHEVAEAMARARLAAARKAA